MIRRRNANNNNNNSDGGNHEQHDGNDRMRDNSSNRNERDRNKDEEEERNDEKDNVVGGTVSTTTMMSMMIRTKEPVPVAVVQRRRQRQNLPSISRAVRICGCTAALLLSGGGYVLASMMRRWFPRTMATFAEELATLLLVPSSSSSSASELPGSASTSFLLKKQQQEQRQRQRQPQSNNGQQRQQAKAKARNAAVAEVDLHLVFTTHCDEPRHEWQSYVFLYHVVASGQRGSVTRIVSGCKTPKDEDRLRKGHDIMRQSLVSGRSTGGETDDKNAAAGDDDRFLIHFTPEYKYKPMALLHWMENALGYDNSNNNKENPQKYDATVFILMHVDQILLKPLTADYQPHVLWNAGSSGWPVTLGKPVAQLQLHSMGWMNHVANITYIRDYIMIQQEQQEEENKKQQQGSSSLVGGLLFGGRTTGGDDSSSESGGAGAIANSSFSFRNGTHILQQKRYNAAPPIMMVGRDLIRIVRAWAKIVVPVDQLATEWLERAAAAAAAGTGGRQQLPPNERGLVNFDADGYAYTITAAYLNLHHQLAKSYVISNVDTPNREGWSVLLEDPDEPWSPHTGVDLDRICRAARRPLEHQPGDNNLHAASDALRYLPHTIRYVREYELGRWYFSLEEMPDNFLSCSRALLAEPPTPWSDLARAPPAFGGELPNRISKVDYKPAPPLPMGKRHRITAALCLTIPALNEAALHYKRRVCSNRTLTTARTYFLHKAQR